MLTDPEYLELLLKEPEQTFFYHDRPVLYTVSHHGESYLIALAEEDDEKQTESFLLIQHSEDTYALLKGSLITPREFFTHPNNTAHLAVIGYTEDRPTLISGKQYADTSSIPTDYLPTEDARWK